MQVPIFKLKINTLAQRTFGQRPQPPHPAGHGNLHGCFYVVITSMLLPEISVKDDGFVCVGVDKLHSRHRSLSIPAEPVVVDFGRDAKRINPKLCIDIRYAVEPVHKSWMRLT